MEGQHPFSRQGGIGPGKDSFLLAVITLPVFFPGEAECLEGLLAAGLEKLHLRKPGAGSAEMEGLLRQIAPRWHSRLVLHGSRKLWTLAARYGIPQVHCPLDELPEQKPGGRAAGVPDREAPMALSASLHSWEELKKIEGAGLAYVFMSPVFDSISKPGYPANPDLLQRPAGPYPSKVIGLGGVNKDTIGGLVRGGWDGAAILGWIWEEPDAAVERYEQLKKIITGECQ
jgi:thiamine-phosphate pyrophosphorylase